MSLGRELRCGGGIFAGWIVELGSFPKWLVKRWRMVSPLNFGRMCR
jgi:hypothetical protein